MEDYLNPGETTQFTAGPYDPETGKPEYRIDLNINPVKAGIDSDEPSRVTIAPRIVKDGEGFIWVWDIENYSDRGFFYKTTAEN